MASCSGKNCASHLVLEQRPVNLLFDSAPESISLEGSCSSTLVLRDFEDACFFLFPGLSAGFPDVEGFEKEESEDLVLDGLL